MEELFEFEGQEYTLAEVQNAAKAKSLSIDDYIKEYNISRKEGKTSPTTPGAVVEETAAPELEFPSVDSLPEYPGANLEYVNPLTDPAVDKYEIIKNRYFINTADPMKGAQRIEQEKANQKYLDSLPKKFDKGYFTKEEREAYEKYKETGNIDSSLLKDAYVRPINPETLEPYTGLQMVENILEDFVPGLKMQLKGLQSMGIEFISKTAGKDAADFLLGDIDIDAKVVKKDNKYFYEKDGIVEKEIGTTTNKKQKEIFENYMQLQNAMQYKGSISEGFKSGDLATTITGIGNAFSGAVQTMVPAYFTSGYSLYPQIAGSMFMDFNIAKAKALYKNDPKAFNKLIDNNQLDFSTPASLALLSSISEKIGFDKVTKAINASPFTGQFLVKTLWAGGTEAGTGYAQFLIEETNNNLGKQMPIGKAIEETGKVAFSPEALEASLQEAFGGIGISIAGRGIKAVTGIRADVYPNIEDDINKLSDLKQKYANAKNEIVSEGIQNQITELEEKIKNGMIRSNGIFLNSSEKELSDINNLVDLKQKQIERTKKLIEAKDKGEISEQDYLDALEGYKQSFIAAKNKINGITETISKKANKSAAEVEKLYQEKGKEGIAEIVELYRPMAERLAMKRRNVPGFDKQLLTDEILTGERGILDLINKYDPAANPGVTLPMYVNKFAATRAIEASKRILKTEFETDVTEAKGITDTVESDTQIETKQEAQQEVKKALAQDLNLSEDTQNEIVTAVEKTLGTKLPAVTDKGFKPALTKGFRTELTNTLKKVFGRTAAYEQFLRDNFEKIYPAIPQETINKKFKEFNEAVVDPETGKQLRERTAEGKKVFKKRDITKAEFIKYFLDAPGNVKGARKTSLAEVIADEVGLDNVLDALSKPEVVEKFKAIQELQGQEVPSNFIEIISEKIDRVIQKLENYQKSPKLRASLGIGPIAVNSAIVFVKAFKKAIKITGNFIEALNIAIKEFKKYLKSQNLSQQQINEAIEVVKSIDENVDENIAADIQAAINNAYVKGLETKTFTEYKANKSNVKEIFNKAKEKGLPINDFNKFYKILQETKGSIENDKNALNSYFNFVNKVALNIDSNIINNTFGKTFFKYFLGVHKRNTGSEDTKNNPYIVELEKNIKNNAEKNILSDFTISKLKNAPKPIKASNILARYRTALSKNNLNKKWANNQIKDITNAEKNNPLVYDALNSVLIDILYQSKNETEALENIKNIIQLKQFNTNARKGEADLAIIKGFDLEKISSTETKIEHLNTSNKHAITTAIGIITDNLNSKEITKFHGIIGYREIFDKYDTTKAEKVSEAGIFKIKNKEDSSRIYIINDNFNTTLRDLQEKNIKKEPTVSLDRQFNELLQATTKVDWAKEFSPVKAKLLGRGKGKKIFIPYSADDFVGLLYATLGRKEVGDKQMEWYNENLLRPYSRAIQQYEAQKQKSLREWMALKKEAAKDVPGGLKKQNDSGFTNQDSVRMYIWRKQGMEIEGLDAKSISENLEVVNNNPKLKEFADRLIALNPEGYPPPSIDWSSGDITTDLVSYINDVKRSEYLTQWKENVAEIFNDRNKNKLKALYGDAYVKALDNMLYRMEKGRNRYKDASDAEKAFMNWTNNSVGAIMFFNARSAVLQTLSSVNFINFSDNNPINASLAFLNQKQYWNDFSTLFNSDFLKQRRTGLQTDINADEIANAAATSKNKARAVLSAILKFGFTPTQIADSFAIASGGATMYRNRIKKYLKEGLSKEEAEAKAFTDFQEIAEETQQSARPDRISMQQAGALGRLILAFGNTPMQYARLTKKATLDLINGRGDWKTNISKIAYYSVIQNIIFSALQQGMFALLFDDEDDEKVQSRLFRIGNSSIDTLLRGIGVYGAAAATVKNMIFKIIEESEKSRPDYKQLAIEATSISPPINSKLRKLESAGKTFTYKQSKEKVFTEGFSLENPAFLAAGKVISAGTNLPADRVVQKMDHIYTAMQPETELWQGIALSLGWSEWDLGMIEKQTKKELQKSRSGINSRSRTRTRTRKRN